MGEVFGPNHIYAPRVHDETADWLPHDPSYLDGITGGQLSIAGEMPVVCSAGSVTSASIHLLECAGLRHPQRLFTFRAGQALDAVAAALTPSYRLVPQHVFPEASPLADRCWIPSQLLRDLNNKGKLESLVSADFVPGRRVTGRAAFFGEEHSRLPAVIKVVSDQSSAGGCGVMICRDRGDLAVAREKFARAGEVVVEELLKVARSPCLNFAVMSDGAVVYLGHADQDIAPDGKFRGNWLMLGETLPDEVVRPAKASVTRAAELGYRGFAGVDLVVTPDERVYVVDLNFRLNASTPAVLLAPALADRLGGGVGHFRTFNGPSSAGELANALTPFVKELRVVPLSLFDPIAGGYASGSPTAQALIIGATKSDVTATERDLARLGIL